MKTNHIYLQSMILNDPIWCVFLKLIIFFCHFPLQMFLTLAIGNTKFHTSNSFPIYITKDNWFWVFCRPQKYWISPCIRLAQNGICLRKTMFNDYGRNDMFYVLKPPIFTFERFGAINARLPCGTRISALMYFGWLWAMF